MSESVVSFTWAARLARDAAGALDALRLAPGLELLATDGDLWLRARDPDAETLAQLRTVPWSESYTVLADGSLRPAGRFLPEGSLPGGEWQPLTTALAPTLPSPAFTASRPAGVPLQLIEAREWFAPNLVITSPEAWGAFVETTAEVRLARLRFAQTDDEVVVRGDPLPALSGEHFVENAGVAIPVDTSFSPAVSAATVRAALGLGAGDLAVWKRSGEIARIPREAWLPADRATVRMMNSSDAH
jgi:hypothetical protein